MNMALLLKMGAFAKRETNKYIFNPIDFLLIFMGYN